MSRLPAPGYSRLRAPGFTKPTVAAVSQIPLPDDNQEKSTLGKPPQSQLTQPSLIQPVRSQQSTLQGIRASRTASAKAPSKEANTSHGTGPYDRSKPATNQIPYVGKKRVTGALKAPVSRVVNGLKPPEATGNPKEKVNEKVLPANKKVSPPNKKMGNADSFSKPVKRQLIPDGSNAQSKLVRPKGTIARPNSVAGTTQPRIPGLIKKTNSPMASKKGISRSLQSLPQGIKPRGNTTMSRMKSTSSDELSKNNTVANMSKPKLATIPSVRSGLLSRFGKPSVTRPRTSSYKNNAENSVTISTPCQVIKVDASKQFDKLAISPIIDNSLLETENVTKTDTVNGTFDSSLSSAPIPVRDVTIPSDESASFSDVIPIRDKELTSSNPFAEPSFNATYNKTTLPAGSKTINLDASVEGERALDSTKLLTLAVNAASAVRNNNNCNATRNLNQTRSMGVSQVDSALQDATQNNDLGVTFKLPNMGDLNASASFFNQTRVIHNKTTNVKDDTNALNATRVITNDGNNDGDNKAGDMVTRYDMLDEADFIINQPMPSNLCDNTPIKMDDNGNDELLDGKPSFADDIMKVIAAISSNVSTQILSSVVMTTSPMKQAASPMTEHVLHHKVVSTVTSTDQCDAAPNSVLLDNVKSNDTVDNTMEEDTPQQRQKSNTICEDNSAPPRTPKKVEADDDDTFFDIGTRAYSVSVADLRRNKVTRRNTFQAHDAAKFRAPKEMNLLETLEGNIVMDNTSFLQFSNDTRSLKTMLLKLKRTLLEADCPSPLVKAPLKRSNSCAVRKLSDSSQHMPPLSPRNSNSSPMAVVDPLVSKTSKEKKNVIPSSTTSTTATTHQEKEEATVTLDEKFHEALRRIEELEKETECHKYTIKLLQTQLETTSQNEDEMLEENILLREEVNNLNEKLQRVLSAKGARERNLSSGSYKEDFDISDATSRKGILQRMYSNETND